MNTTSTDHTSRTDDPHTTGHLYDGIEEFDNPLPGWWKWIFVASIAFCPPYWLYYHGGTPGRSVQDDYSLALAENTRLQFEEIGELQPTEQTIVKYMHDDSWRRVGRIVFQTNCVSCHGREGEGKVGPNLTDEFYKNVNNLEDIAHVINNGAAAGAMPQWSNRLHPNEVVLVAAYVASLRGEDLQGPRGPEGKTIPAWPEPTASEEESPDNES
ncbi:cbb3-type cytochrome c oxidase N-terminal domain-containing protein [Allorhodopirellula heiligendammensis]|uniref:Cbb3-type cytochrome c oxidase subunit CcoP n=1 Tax=Allorhodopirellula heiligendammensis TaxID=2714739 RepID=A0A5C6BWP6_9BACT|nr:cbb3-type cytochrome c oxidase N-terminal domain-containing protein [Allorhodopirellula heiligendammensis]TWU15686.1 Cbb3-type cytochrome c oxidase subunit CcoP [Allorhodopirellula heiligendammensis]|tara:strand:+ start:217 stop:855 length:639 start_codon:yes stop_codon:yes gene_type:complete